LGKKGDCWLNTFCDTFSKSGGIPPTAIISDRRSWIWGVGDDFISICFLKLPLFSPLYRFSAPWKAGLWVKWLAVSLFHGESGGLPLFSPSENKNYRFAALRLPFCSPSVDIDGLLRKD